jgi:hypothetical protein
MEDEKLSEIYSFSKFDDPEIQIGMSKVLKDRGLLEGWTWYHATDESGHNGAFCPASIPYAIGTDGSGKWASFDPNEMERLDIFRADTQDPAVASDAWGLIEFGQEGSFESSEETSLYKLSEEERAKIEESDFVIF